MSGVYRWKDLTELWHGTCDLMFMGTKESGEVVQQGLTTYMYDPVLKADSLNYEMEVATDLWMTRGRFTGLQRDYIDPVSLREFVGKAGLVKSKQGQIAQMQCRMKGQRHLSFRWGNCILGYTFRAFPNPVLTMMSRTSMVTRMGGLDLALTLCIGKLIAEERGEDYRSYGFVWHASSLQHSALQGVPYWFSSGWHEEIDEYTDEEIIARPALKAMRHQLEYFQKLDDKGVESKLGTRRRVREQRAEFEANGTVKVGKGDDPVDVNTLNLDKLREPLHAEEDED